MLLRCSQFWLCSCLASCLGNGLLLIVTFWHCLSEAESALCPPPVWACFPVQIARFGLPVIWEKITESTLHLGLHPTPPAGSHFESAFCCGLWRWLVLLKECGAWGERPSHLEGMHSWRKLKLERAATFPAIQSFVFVFTRILLVSLQWVSGGMGGEVLLVRWRGSVSMAIFVVERCCFV